MYSAYREKMTSCKIFDKFFLQDGGRKFQQIEVVQHVGYVPTQAHSTPLILNNIVCSSQAKVYLIKLIEKK